jgi:diguanylate cyclase (GGDEF)-like protein
MDDGGRHDGRPLHVLVARAFDGPELGQGEDREAASTTRAVLWLSLLGSLTYGVALVLLRRRWVLAAAVVGIGAMIPQILVSTHLLGPQAGMHVFLIAIGPAVFMVFTDARSAFRWLFSLTGAAVFVYCQFALQPTSAALSLSPDAARLIFSINAGAAGLLVAVLAAVEHSRRRVSAADARRATNRAQFLANTDPLTGLANRRPVMDELERISAEGDYCVVVADLDNFKELNDHYGHLCGDHVLAGIGAELVHHVRALDTVGRWGGEEFIFVLPGTCLADATGFAERLRTAIEACSFEYGGHTHCVTASFGVADGADDGMSHRVVRRADDAMYEAKAAGRNAVRCRPLSSVVAEPPTRGIPVVHRLRAGAKDSL